MTVRHVPASLVFVLFCVVLSTFAQDEAPVEVCNIISAAQCFADMATLPRIETLTHDPHVQIVTPCQAQVDTLDALQKCLAAHTAGCPSLQRDVTASVATATRFCSSVLRECTAGGETYVSKYRSLNTCIGNMFNGFGKENVTLIDLCLDYERCLLNASHSCSALDNTVVTWWQHFRSSCQATQHNYTLDAPPAAENGTQPDYEMRCPSLNDVAMAVDGCYRLARNKVRVVAHNVTMYCSAVAEFSTCVTHAFDEQKCPELHTLYNNSMQRFHQATAVFCQAEAPCEMGAVQSCFEEFEQSIWQLKTLVAMTDLPLAAITTDLTAALREHFRQTTAVLSDVTNICEHSETQIAATDHCMGQSTVGCAEGLQDMFLANVEYIRHLCDDLDNCTGNETFQKHMAACTDAANTALAELAREFAEDGGNLTHFEIDLCGTFHSLLTCVDALLSPCASLSPHVRSLMYLLTRDLQPVCEQDRLGKNISMLALPVDPSLVTFLECTDLIERGAEIGRCNQVYLERLFEQPTQFDHICRTVNEWQECLSAESLSRCPQLSTELLTHVRQVRAHLQGTCPEPTTLPPPPPLTDEAPSSSPAPGSNGRALTDDGNTAASIGASWHMGVQLSALFLVLVLRG